MEDDREKEGETKKTKEWINGKCIKIAQGGRYGFDHLPRSLTAWLDPNCQVTLANHLWAAGWNVLPPSVVNINYSSSSHITTTESPLCKAKFASVEWVFLRLRKKDHNALMNVLVHHKNIWWFVGQRKLMKQQSGNMANQSLTMEYNETAKISVSLKDVCIKWRKKQLLY